MRILRTYILQEHVGPFFATMSGLTAALLVGHIIKFAELVIAKGVSLLDILRLLIYLIPSLLSFTIPMASLIAMVMAFGRLSTDYELIAMRASGVAPIRLVSPVLVAGLVISAVLFLINDRLVPSTHLAFRKQLKAIGLKQPTAYIEPGTFIKEFPPYTMFVYQVEGKKLLDVRIYEPQEAGPTRTIIAEHGEFEPTPDRHGVRMTLYDGTMDQWDPLHPGMFYKITFGNYTMVLQTQREDPKHIQKKLKEMTLQELIRERHRLQPQDIDTTPIAFEFHRRIASSFAVVVFVLFGLALGLRLHHHERLISFVWVFGIFLTYYLGSLGMTAIALKGWLPAWLTMWIPNLAGLSISGILVARAVRR